MCIRDRECTACTASVTVTDQDGDSASASLIIKCTALKVKLTKETPKENTVPIGGKATFLAEVFADDKSAGGTFSYIWERNPDTLFGDCLLYTSDAADDLLCVDLGGRRIIK